MSGRDGPTLRPRERSPLASSHRRWPDISAEASLVLAICAIVVVLGESLLERQIAECYTSRAVTVDRMITATLVCSGLAFVLAVAAFIGRSRRRVLATLAIGVAASAGWVAFGGYQCFVMTA